MASVSDFVKDFTPREREALDAALREGERVRWAVRPLCRFEVGELAAFAFLELICAAFLFVPGLLGYLLYTHAPSESAVKLLLLAGFFSVFVVVGLCLSTLPLREYRRRRWTLYLLTNHRALVLSPGETHAFPLREDMLRARVFRPHGSGDLLFEGESGFTRLPDLARAHYELNEAIYALLDAAERRV